MLKHIHAETKIELAHLIVKCAPPNVKKFQIAQRMAPSGYLVSYGTDGHSIHGLAVELGLEEKIIREKKSEPVYIPGKRTLLAQHLGKTGFVLFK